MKFSSLLDANLNSLNSTKEAYVRLQQEASSLRDKHDLQSEIDSIVEHLKRADNRSDWGSYSKMFNKYQKEVYNAANY